MRKSGENFSQIGANTTLEPQDEEESCKTSDTLEVKPVEHADAVAAASSSNSNPSISHKIIRPHASVEETMISPEAQRARARNPEEPLQSAPHRPKSLSMDNMAPNNANIPEHNNNNQPQSNNKGMNMFKGRLFRSLKVSPCSSNFPGVIAQNVIISPVVVQHHQDAENNNNTAPPTTEICVTISAPGSNDSMENICRICHDSPSSEKLIKPCLCKGSMGTVHRACLEHWLGESGKGACEICGQEFNTVRVPKYKGIRSFCAWLKHPIAPTDTRNFFFDLACFIILTPLAVLSGWLCIIGAQTYANDRHNASSSVRRMRTETVAMRANRDISNATWTSIGLLSLTGTLVAAYMIWIFVAIRYHIQVWREWQQRNYIVTIVPLSNGEFCFTPGSGNVGARKGRRGRRVQRSDESMRNENNADPNQTAAIDTDNNNPLAAPKDSGSDTTTAQNSAHQVTNGGHVNILIVAANSNSMERGVSSTVVLDAHSSA